MSATHRYYARVFELEPPKTLFVMELKGLDTIPAIEHCQRTLGGRSIGAAWGTGIELWVDLETIALCVFPMTPEVMSLMRELLGVRNGKDRQEDARAPSQG